MFPTDMIAENKTALVQTGTETALKARQVTPAWVSLSSQLYSSEGSDKSADN